jgi:hypothetical protein
VKAGSQTQAGVDTGLRLAQLEFWPADAVERLRGSWITTAEQLVGIAATSGGLSALVEQTELTEDQLRQLLELTRKRLSPDVRRRLSSPVDTSQFGLGALPPPRSGKQK